MSAKFGDPRLPPNFWAKVQLASGGCWLWTGGRQGIGYGAFAVNRKTQLAHRVAYLALVGPITEQTLDHRCRNRACVNPAHLEPCSNRENTLRGNGITALCARKTHCLRGHPLSGDNLYLNPNDKAGWRHCRTCRALAVKRWQYRTRANKENAN